MAEHQTKLRHLFLAGTSEAEPYTSPNEGGGDVRLPSVHRKTHGERLLQQIEHARQEVQARDAARDVIAFEGRQGIYIELSSAPRFELALKSLDLIRSGIQLVVARESGGTRYATVYVPEGQLGQLEKRIEEYLTEETGTGNPKNRTLVESIAEIRIAALESFWTDEPALFPAPGKAVWWEVWLRDDGERTLERFDTFARALGLRVGEQHLRFPDRLVALAWGTREQMTSSVELLNVIAELRLAKEVPAAFTQMSTVEQADWATDLKRRTTPPPSDAPAVCILDTGVNRGHPLLESVTAADDLHAYNPGWGVADHSGHGTEMAGVAVYGDLSQVLSSSSPIVLTHRIESVKILPPQGRNPPELYGAITAEGIARAEIAAPQRNRVISTAVTTTEFRDRGQPSSWSAEIDRLCSGAEDEHHRLFLVAAGNVQEDAGLNFRDRNETEGIHDPGQSWNALTVGAFTGRTTIDDPAFEGWTPVARVGDLSPCSTTSCIWQEQWPIKPEIVMEGGNMAMSADGMTADRPDSLSLLTTYFKPQEKLFVATGDTSAGTAGAARLAATIWSHYPKFWPETVRALLVHSAEWTPAMKDELRAPQKKSSHERQHLLRCFGFGAPNLERALWSAKNAVTLIIQDELQPFERDKNKEMHLHTLPWPREVLQDLGDKRVVLCVTLSYFIEPNPARRGWQRRHRYASHGLRFSVIKPTESRDDFRKRINRAARDGDEGSADPTEDGWFLGPELRGKGSLHQDSWMGTAADLAGRNLIAICPVLGWWRERHQLERWTRPARYSLIVSIRTRATDVDIYEAVANLVKIKTVVQP